MILLASFLTLWANGYLIERHMEKLRYKWRKLHRLPWGLWKRNEVSILARDNGKRRRKNGGCAEEDNWVRSDTGTRRNPQSLKLEMRQDSSSQEVHLHTRFETRLSLHKERVSVKKTSSEHWRWWKRGRHCEENLTDVTRSFLWNPRICKSIHPHPHPLAHKAGSVLSLTLKVV